MRADVRVVFGAVVAVAAFAFAATAVEDTDAWTHLALGRDLFELGRFPAAERFTFPAATMPYYNPEWLFGLTLYVAYAAAGFPGVVTLKGLVVAAAFAVLFRDALGPGRDPERRATDAAVALAVVAGALLMSRHRFVERPDIVLMLFLALTIHALNRYLDEGRARLLWLMPVMQVVWVNVHPSIVVGMVPYVAVLAGGLVQRRLHRRFPGAFPLTPSSASLRTIGRVFAAVLAASLLNPYVYEPFVTPFRLVTATWLRHEVIELQPPSLWSYPGVAVATAALVAAFAVRWRRPPFACILLVAPFVYLAFSARRFVFLLAIVATPVVARAARRALARVPRAPARWVAVPAGAIAVLVAVVPAALAVTGTRPFADPFHVPGFGANVIGVPDRALGYLDRIEHRGNVFNVFHWGGYVTWRDYPRRRPFVDGRGYLPPGLLDDMMAVRSDAVRLRQLSTQLGFDAAIVDYPRNVMTDETPNLDLALASAEWALVYWDDLALVYLRRTPALEAVIARDEYRAVKPAMGAGYLRRRLGDTARTGAIEQELRRNIAETGSSTAYALLGFVYNELGLHAQAITALERVVEFPLGSNVLNAELALGFAHSRRGDLARAVVHYRRALAIDEDPLTLHNTGLVLEKLGQEGEAMRHFERALRKDPNLAPAYPALMRVVRRLGDEARARELEGRYAAALAQAQAEGHFKRGVKLYFEGQLHEAAEAFGASVRTHARNAAARSNLGFVYYDLGKLDDAFGEQKTALDIDPAFANAHYALALIARRRGDEAGARAHFAQYLTLEPKGYWARRAQAALADLTPR